jgi:hypothetical protein
MPGSDSPRLPATLEPAPVVFDDVGVLLSNPQHWGDWIAKRPDRAALFNDTFRIVVRLESHTGWAPMRLLEQVGCSTKTESDLEQLDATRLARCLEYLKWVESLLPDLDVEYDKRLTVSGAARFFDFGGRDLAACKQAMAGGGFSPMEYLRLGEVAEAWRVARQQLPGEAGDQARARDERNPFTEAEEAPHLRAERIALLDEGDASELLGSRVAERIWSHLQVCPLCNEAGIHTIERGLTPGGIGLPSVHVELPPGARSVSVTSHSSHVPTRATSVTRR